MSSHYMSYVTRWLFSTSHKDIGILYLIYGMVSAMVATAMSVIIRLELSGPGQCSYTVITKYLTC